MIYAIITIIILGGILMELLQLSYFKKVADLQHVTKAAEELHVSQPAISKTIHELEDELGLQLFDRVGRKIVLNGSGRILLRTANKIFGEIDAMYVELGKEKAFRDTLVTISVQVASSLLPDIINGFKKKNPTAQLRIVQHHNMDSENLNNDVSFCSSQYEVNSDHGCSVLKENILLAVPYEHPFAKLDKISLAQTATEPLIGLHYGQLKNSMDMFCKMAGFTPAYVLECDDPATMRSLINMQLGVSFVPEVTWGFVHTNNLKLIPIYEPQCFRYINIKWKSNGYISPMALKFKDYVINFFRHLNDTAH